MTLDYDFLDKSIPELQAAMGMEGMQFPHGTRRDRIKMIGNAVCPPVMRAI